VSEGSTGTSVIA